MMNRPFTGMLRDAPGHVYVLDEYKRLYICINEYIVQHYKWDIDNNINNVLVSSGFTIRTYTKDEVLVTRPISLETQHFITQYIIALKKLCWMHILVTKVLNGYDSMCMGCDEVCKVVRSGDFLKTCDGVFDLGCCGKKLIIDVMIDDALLNVPSFAGARGGVDAYVE